MKKLFILVCLFIANIAYATPFDTKKFPAAPNNGDVWRHANGLVYKYYATQDVWRLQLDYLYPKDDPCDQTSITNAIADAGGATATMIINQTCNLTGNVTIPSNISVIVEKSGSFVCNGGAPTFQGDFQAGIYPIFSGANADDVVFSQAVDKLYFDWFGAISDGVTSNNEAAIETAILVAARNHKKVYCDGKYIIDNEITIDDTLTGVSKIFDFAIEGSNRGCEIEVDAAVAVGGTLTHVMAIGDASDSSPDEQFKISNITFDANSRAVIGLDLQGSSNVEVYSCEVNDAHEDGMRLGNWAVSAHHNRLISNTEACFELYGNYPGGYVSNINLNNNTCVTGKHGVTFSATPRKVNIVQNDFEQLTQTVILNNLGAWGLVIDQNYFEQNGSTADSIDLIAATWAEGITPVNVDAMITIAGAVGSPELFTSSGIVITNNTFASTNTSDYLIALSRVDAPVIKGNVINRASVPYAGKFLYLFGSGLSNYRTGYGPVGQETLNLNGNEFGEMTIDEIVTIDSARPASIAAGLVLSKWESEVTETKRINMLPWSLNSLTAVGDTALAMVGWDDDGQGIVYSIQGVTQKSATMTVVDATKIADYQGVPLRISAYTKVPDTANLLSIKLYDGVNTVELKQEGTGATPTLVTDWTYQEGIMIVDSAASELTLTLENAAITDINLIKNLQIAPAWVPYGVYEEPAHEVRTVTTANLPTLCATSECAGITYYDSTISSFVAWDGTTWQANSLFTKAGTEITTTTAGDSLVLDTTLAGTSTNPSVAFGDGDSGLYQSADDTLVITLGGTGWYFFNNSSIYSATTGGFQISRLNSSNTLPAYTVNDDSTTGLGFNAIGEFSLIANSKEIARGDANEQFIINPAADYPGAAGTPSLAFGDQDTGWYESADDVLIQAVAGLAKLITTTTGTYANTTKGAYMLYTAVSGTAPGWAFNGDSNTGVGTAGDDQLSLIAGGVEGIRVTESATSPAIQVDVNGGLRPVKVTADPCGVLSEGSIFYNDTSDYMCFCNGAGADVQMHSPATACF